jgi:hypothetical protein
LTARNVEGSHRMFAEKNAYPEYERHLVVSVRR